MPIVVVRFSEPVAARNVVQTVRMPDLLGIGMPFDIDMLFPMFFYEITMHVEKLPMLRHHEDGDSQRGYLDFGNGVDFDARNIEDVRIIL